VNPIVVGVDIGTSGVRAAAVGESGDVVAEAEAGMATLRGAPNDPQTWWRGVESCFSELAKRCRLDDVRGVAVDGTSGTMLAVNEQGRPIGAPIMYDEPCEDVRVLETIAAYAPRNTAALGRTSGLARALLMQRRPGVRRLLHQADWIAGRLIGRFEYSDANNALKTGYDPVAARWPDWVARAGVDRDRLPTVVAPGEPLAPIGAEGRAFGLPPTAVVHAGTTDGCASFLATGASEIGDAVTALGSTLVIKLLCEEPISAPAHGVYSHRIGNAWLAGGASNSGGRVIERLFGRDRLASLTAALKPDEPTGLHYYPLIAPGERFPINDPELEPRLSPQPPDDAVFFQAVLEGVAGIEALAYRKLAELGAPTLRSVRTVGGGAKNHGWTEIRKRALKAPFETSLSQEACVGVARLTLRALHG
jgi:D-ribulokinase